MSKAWVAPLGLAIVFLWLAVSIVATGPTLYFLITLSVACTLTAAWMGLAPRFRRDPYDLDVLREFHEREELEALDPGEVAVDADTVICLNCGSNYKRRFPICPFCKCGSSR